MKGWPLIGEHVYRIWTDAVSDMKPVLLQVMPRLKPLGGKLLETSGTVIFGLVEFVAAIVIAGFLYVPGPRLARTLRSLLRRVLGQRSEEMLKLAGMDWFDAFCHAFSVMSLGGMSTHDASVGYFDSVPIDGW